MVSFLKLRELIGRATVFSITTEYAVTAQKSVYVGVSVYVQSYGVI